MEVKDYPGNGGHGFSGSGTQQALGKRPILWSFLLLCLGNAFRAINSAGTFTSQQLPNLYTQLWSLDTDVQITKGT